ncbi:prolipoprotein diacylglyceryl transferase [Kribbella sandramycini]|uniref:prolipoprotein diacylglyceryl transferase n=1 Tax=Kribbella sandramycini TaxID=60450 RepID=UPI0031D9AE78
MSSLITAVMVPAFIPSPSQGVWHVLGLPIRAYALCILAGIFAGYWLTRKRWVARGGSAVVLSDIMFWAIPFGLIGARIWHVITDAELYFGDGRNPVDALKIWNGGLGIWGAVGFGALGAYLACRRAKVSFPAFADAIAPGIALAQVFGRFGNYFNQELFGKPTTRPWGLEIDPAHRPDGYAEFATFHPTFLYEALWNLGVVALILLVARRYTLGHGRAFFLYVAAYTAGRAWIENLRIDEVNHFLGLRLNVWTSLILFVLAVTAFVISARTRPGESPLTTTPGTPTDGPTAEAEAQPTTAPTDTPETEAQPTTSPTAGAAEPAPSSVTTAEPDSSPANPAEAEPAGGPAASVSPADDPTPDGAPR